MTQFNIELLFTEMAQYVKGSAAKPMLLDCFTLAMLLRLLFIAFFV
jgi:hypothetical protein